MTQVLIDRATLEQIVEALELIGFAKLADGTYADKDCKITMALTAGRAALANAEPTKGKPYAWRNPMNGAIISNERKERLRCVGAGYPNFSEPLYAEGVKP